MRRKSAKNKMIMFLCVALVFMGIGYSIFNSTLNISGTATSSGSFDVKITNVVLKEKSTKVTDTTEYKANNDYGTVANLSATFNEPTDYITYTITVSNLGSIDALISVTTNPQTDEKNNFKMSCDAVNKTELPARTGTTEFDCTMIFDEGKNLTTITGEENASLTVTVDAVQKSGQQNQGGADQQEENDLQFLVDSNGVITKYLGSDTSITIPATYQSSTAVEYFDFDACIPVAISYYNQTSEQAESTCNSVEEAFNNGTLGQNGLPSHSDLVYMNIIKSNYESNGIVPITGIGDDVFKKMNITNVDLSQATNLKTIGEGAFTDNQLSGTLTIPSGVTSIGSSAFSGSQLSGTLIIPSSVTSIGDSAFSGNQLSSLVFANNSSLQTIEGGVFGGNQLSGTLTIPSSVTSIGSSAFSGNQLSSLVFESNSNLQTIGSNAFSDNPLSGTLTIPSSVTSIGSSAFYSSIKNITALTIPNSVTTIGNNVFTGGTIQSLSIDVQSIGSNAFQSVNMETFTLGSHVQTIGEGAFSNNQLSGTLTILSSVTSIGSSAFYGNQLSSLVFESNSNLQTIGDHAFYDNPLSGTLTIPSSVTSIGSSAFYSSIKNITALTIPNSVTTIGNDAFDGGTIQSLSIDTKSIDSYAFQSVNMETLTLGSHVQTIGEGAFIDNPLSGTLTIPSSVISIGSSAFYSSIKNITALTIPNSVTTIGNDAFDGGTIQSLSIDVQSIDSYAFESFNMETLTLGSHVQTIGEFAFYTNQLSGTLTIPSSVTSIGINAFQSNQLSRLVFESNSNLQTIGSNVFSGNQISGTLTIPSSVTSIGSSAFQSNQLSRLVFESDSNLQTIGDTAFINNQISGTLTIPSSVTSIGDYAFYGNKINTLNIGSGLTFLGDSAFKNNYDSTTSSYTIQEVNIDMTEETWNSRGLPIGDWDGNVTPTYKSE